MTKHSLFLYDNVKVNQVTANSPTPMGSKFDVISKSHKGEKDYSKGLNI